MSLDPRKCGQLGLDVSKVAAHRPEQARADRIRAYDHLIEDDTADQSWVSQWSDLDTNRLTSRKSPHDVGEHIKMLWIGNCSKRGALPNLGFKLLYT